MTELDFAFVADALLGLCAPSDDRPFYSEEAFRAKIATQSKREPLFAQFQRALGGDVLLEAEMRAIVAAADLTDLQRETLELRLEGVCFEAIGGRRGNTKQAAQRSFAAAIKKIVRASNVYKYAGLRDIYREEVARGRIPRSYGTIRGKAHP